ncbi:Histone deacetylase complex subunit SAP25 [Apodemus speciosus]|uniref:Histone deacetylase complex subunit SAP25 n=1 Tax=Apodemus speciosus TaxID=105296 RepID=A0ABQ0EU58_APOSI
MLARSPGPPARPSPGGSSCRPPGARPASRPHRPQVTAQVAPSRMTPLPLRDPGHPAMAGAPLVPSWGGCGSAPGRQGAGGQGASLSSRTLCHPSWPMYDDWGRIATPPGQPEEEQAVAQDAGLPVTNHEDVFLLDPLLPRGQRVPLRLPKPPQQAVGSRKLLLPAPIMAPSVHPSSSQACPSTWLSEAEMIALAGLLQMSQGEQTPSSLPSAGCPDPVSVSVSEDPGPSGGHSCPGSADP